MVKEALNSINADYLRLKKNVIFTIINFKGKFRGQHNSIRIILFFLFDNREEQMVNIYGSYRPKL